MKTFVEFLEEKYGNSLEEMTRGKGPNVPIRHIVMNRVIPPARITGYAAKGIADLVGRGVASGVTSAGSGIIKAGEMAQAGIDRIPGIDKITSGITKASMPSEQPPISKRKLPKPVSTLKINTPQEKQTKTQELMDTIKKMNEFGGSIFDVHNEK